MAINRQILRGIVFAGLFAIPFVPFLVSGAFFFPFITTKAFAFRTIVEIIFGAWAVLALVAPEYRPKKGAILYALAAFLVVVGLADLFGAEPIKSFWSNFERMEGYVTLLHLGALFLVMSSVFLEQEWRWWWNTTLAASAIMIFYCLFQLAGVVEIHQGGVRVDGTLGNAAYLALYFLIHIFISLLLLFRSKTKGLRWTYIALLLGQVMILYFTATRGAILGLLGGLSVIAILNVTNKEDHRVKKASRILLGSLIVLMVGFFFIRNTNFVQGSPVLARFATLSLNAWKTEGRAFVWPMAIEGIKERPLLGWGQDNFNYVFAEHYSGKMFRLEPWFDRAHNIFLDWGIAAGLLGLGAYLSLYVVLLLAILKSSALTRIDRSVLTGLIAAYFFNNVFVFDNLVSYVFFISLLAYVHGQTGRAWQTTPSAVGEHRSLALALPIALITLGIIYFVNVKPIVANANLIGALQILQTNGANKAGAMEHLKKAYNASRLGRPEVVEWISTSAPTILSDESIPLPERSAYFLFAVDAIEGMTKELEGDPRYEIIAGSFYTNVGYLNEALTHFARAQELMPEKQIIHFNIGQILYYKKDYEGALAAFKRAYDLAPEYEEAKAIYEATLKEIPR